MDLLQKCGGVVDFEDIKARYFIYAHGLRQKLGVKAYLLDDYICRLFADMYKSAARFVPSAEYGMSMTVNIGHLTPET